MTAYQQSLAMFREIGDVRREATLLGNLAMSLAKLNRYDEAEASIRRKADLTRDVDPAACQDAESWLVVRAAAAGLCPWTHVSPIRAWLARLRA